MKMSPVIHFEMPADDRARMAKFYTEVFGWHTQMMGPDMGDYVVVATTESDDDGPKKPGAINGGFYSQKPDWAGPYPSVANAGGDIDQSMKAGGDSRGKVLREPMGIPRDGQDAQLFGTQSNP